MRRFAGLALAAALLSACQKPPEQKVTDAYVRLPAVAGGPAAAYFKVYGGPNADRLVDVTGDFAIRTELHMSMNEGGMAGMKQIEGGVAVPAGGKVEFKPGGMHAMMFGVRAGLAPPAAMPMTFTFASGARILYDAPVVRAGDK